MIYVTGHVTGEGVSENYQIRITSGDDGRNKLRMFHGRIFGIVLCFCILAVNCASGMLLCFSRNS